MTRVTSCIKETGTLQKYCGALVALLESCLHHNLMPVGHLRDDDPPHAKIASDVIACIVLVSIRICCFKIFCLQFYVMQFFNFLILTDKCNLVKCKVNILIIAILL